MGKASRNKADRGSTETTTRQDKIEAAAPRRRLGGSRFIIGTAVAVVAIIAVVVGVIVGTSGARDRATAGGSTLPVNAAAMGAPIIANAQATLVANAPTLDIYQDYQCPNCKQFEATYGPTIDALAEAGKVAYRVHLLSFLDDNLRNDSSNRAANAATCADDAGAFVAFNEAIYAGQPAEGTGYTAADLAGFARTAGITGAALDTWQACTDGRDHNQYVESVQTQGTKDGVNSTPTVQINGKALDLNAIGGPEGLTAMITAATQ